MTTEINDRNSSDVTDGGREIHVGPLVGMAMILPVVGGEQNFGMEPGSRVQKEGATCARISREDRGLTICRGGECGKLLLLQTRVATGGGRLRRRGASFLRGRHERSLFRVSDSGGGHPLRDEIATTAQRGKRAG